MVRRQYPTSSSSVGIFDARKSLKVFLEDSASQLSANISVIITPQAIPHEGSGFDFRIETPEAEEMVPPEVPIEQVTRYLAALQTEYSRPTMRDEIIVTADTVVILNNRILNKTTDRKDALNMLSALSGNTHRVMTGVSIVSEEKEESFDETTAVKFENCPERKSSFMSITFNPTIKLALTGSKIACRRE